MYKTGVMNQTVFRDELQMLLNEVGQSIYDTTHDVQLWAGYVADLLECLELFSMADDPLHPEQYELMLARLKDQIAARLKNGTW